MEKSEIEVSGKKVVLRELTYGEYREAAQRAKAQNIDVNEVVVASAIVSWDFTDPLTGKPLPIAAESFSKIKPFGDVIAIIDAFNKLNHLQVEEQKK